MNTSPTRRCWIVLVLAMTAAGPAGCGGDDDATVEGDVETTTTNSPPTTIATIAASSTTAVSPATNLQPPAPAATEPASPTQAARIKTFMFMPTPMRITVGTTVTWTNEDEIRHTVTSARRTYDDQGMQKEITPGPPGFDFELDGQGSTATFTFTEKGTFPYLCTIHPGMDSEVIVE